MGEGVMGRRLQLEWHESESELKQCYQREKHGERRTRLQALWLLRQGKRVADVAIRPENTSLWSRMYRYSSGENAFRRGSPGYVFRNSASCPGSRTGSWRNMRMLMRLKIAVLAPMPIASVKIAMSAKAGFLIRARTA